MTRKTWFVSDTHFGHRRIVEVKEPTGAYVRPWRDLDSMHRDMIARWNARVGSNDRVYHLGDVAFGREGMAVLSQLAGRKILVRGNHDYRDLAEYMPWFEDIRGLHAWGDFALSHAPVHPDCVGRWRGNIHGHLHGRRVMLNGRVDPRYFCVSVERTEFAPISWEELDRQWAAERGAVVVDKNSELC